MTQEESAGVLFRGPDGGMYWISTPELAAFRLADDAAAEAVELLGGEDSVQGYTRHNTVKNALFGVSIPTRVVQSITSPRDSASGQATRRRTLLWQGLATNQC